uniref:Uncharacterized protein n=1 Tax=Myotis myotis TaxID=51298 RepID=A0A7J7RUQ8_MYOMY|nr:hypothetical protein mMyoMyo1_010139 [Myotis myotis]
MHVPATDCPERPSDSPDRHRPAWRFMACLPSLWSSGRQTAAREPHAALWPLECGHEVPIALYVRARTWYFVEEPHLRGRSLPTTALGDGAGSLVHRASAKGLGQVAVRGDLPPVNRKWHPTTLPSDDASDRRFLFEEMRHASSPPTAGPEGNLHRLAGRALVWRELGMIFPTAPRAGSATQ